MNFNRHSDLLNIARHVSNVARQCDPHISTKIYVDRCEIDGENLLNLPEVDVVFTTFSALKRLYQSAPKILYLTGPSLKACLLVIIYKFLNFEIQS